VKPLGFTNYEFLFTIESACIWVHLRIDEKCEVSSLKTEGAGPYGLAALAGRDQLFFARRKRNGLFN
jgi:hypothetical protein